MILEILAAAVIGVGTIAFPAGALAAGPGGGGEETTIGNNLSFPAIWSEGLTLPLRGTFGAPQLVTPFQTSGDPSLTLYLQGVEENTWQAENVTATAPVNVSQVDWGDNLEAKSLPLNKPIRVETTLLQDLTTPMLGFTMYSASGSQSTEVFGTDGVTYMSPQATIYSGCARLTIQRLDISRTDPYIANLTWDASKGEWTGTGLVAPPIFNGGVWSGGEGTGYSAEINGSGKAIYGYNWKTGSMSAGDYRLTFSLDPNCPTATLNTFITPSTTVYVTPTTEGSLAAAEADSGGATAKIDGVNNLSYIDVEVGNPTYAPYVPPKPVNTVPPVISGTAVQGQQLSTTNGTWENIPTSYAYHWQSCDTAGASCVNITDATASTYTLTANDVGHRLRVVVTATNTNGSASATSEPTATVAPLPPANTMPPAIFGIAQEGHVLLATHGTWDGSPTSYVYQWQVCNADGVSCADIAGATSGSYALTEAVVGARLRVVVTATNGGGSTSTASAPTGTIKAKPEEPQPRTKARVTLSLQWLAGERLRLWGSVYPPHDGTQLLIQQRTRTGWKLVTRVRLAKATAERSQYTIVLPRGTAGVYRAYLEADTAHLTSTSAEVTARAMARVTLQMQHMTRDRVRLSGTVSPPRDGKKLSIQRRTRTGWTTVATVRLVKATRQSSRYGITLSHPKAGVYRAAFGGDSAYRPANSKTITVR